MNYKTALIVTMGVLFVLGGALAAGSFNILTLERSVTMDVVADDSGILVLTPGNSPLVTQDGDGALNIDMTAAGASGVNVDAILEVGDNSSAANAQSDPGFTVTNAGGDSYTVDFSYDVTSGSAEGDATDNVAFYIYDGTTLIGTASEENAASVTIADTDSVYVVPVIDSRELNAGSDDLSGTLTITAS